MTFDRLTAIVDRPPVARPQRTASRAAATMDASRPVPRIGLGPRPAPVAWMRWPGGPASQRPHPAFRFPNSLSNDSAGSDDGAVAGLEGAQTWASR